jgi:integrase
VNAIKLLMTTAARRGEVMAAKWSEFDLEAGVWIKSSAHTKTKINQFYELGPEALLVLRSMHAGCQETGEDDYLFPGTDRKRPLQDIKKSWAKILKRAGISRFRLHDLRHSYASVLASRGASLHEIARQLEHTQMQTTMRYADLIRERQREVAALFTLRSCPRSRE